MTLRRRERGVVMGHKLEPERWAEQPSISPWPPRSGPRCDGGGGGRGGARGGGGGDTGVLHVN